MTVVSDYRALFSGLSWTPGRTGDGLVLTYSFLTSPNSDFSGTSGFHALTDFEQGLVRAALQQWSAVSGITFIESTNQDSNIEFGFADVSDPLEAGDAKYPNTGLYVGGAPGIGVGSGTSVDVSTVRFNTAYESSSIFAQDFEFVALHEIGHTLGLKHPFDSALAGPSYTLSSDLDNTGETVMSYTSPPGARTPQLGPLDLQAIQSLYGSATGATRPFGQIWSAGTQSMTVFGNTTSAQGLFGSGGNDTFYSLGQWDAISASGGNDTIYLGGKSATVNGGGGYNLVYTGLAYSQGMTSITGEAAFLTVAAGPTHEVLFNVASLIFTNGIYNTATGTFTAFDPSASTAPVSVTASGQQTVGGGTVRIAPGSGGTVTVTGSANVTTSSTGNETVWLNGLVNTMQANGTDWVYSGPGRTTIFGGAQLNTILGGTGTLTYYAGSGANVVFTGTGGLTYFGGTALGIVVASAGSSVNVVGGSGGGDYWGGGNGTIIAGIGPAVSVLVGGTNDKLYSAGSGGDLFGALGANVQMDGSNSTGNDVFFGASGTGSMGFICGSGNDILGLGQGANTVRLGAGTDVVFANTNTTAVSTIIAGTGSALIGLGGQSADLVVAEGTSARNLTLFNFNPASDRITLSGYDSSTRDSIIANQTNSGGNTFLNLPDQTTIALVGAGRIGSSAIDVTATA